MNSNNTVGAAKDTEFFIVTLESCGFSSKAVELLKGRKIERLDVLRSEKEEFKEKFKKYGFTTFPIVMVKEKGQTEYEFIGGCTELGIYLSREAQ